MKLIGYKRLLFALASVVLLIAAALFFTTERQIPLSEVDFSNRPRVRSSFSPKNPDDAQSRTSFEFNRFKNPVTGEIPANIRQKELAFVRKLTQQQQLQNSSIAYSANWELRGPRNVGGRTRALAIDLNFNGSTNRRILAGGISGGVYLSEDDGASWNLRTSLSSHASVTCIAQDPNNRSVWYYGTGEAVGNSAAGGGNFAYWGHGIFKSTDNGNSWSQLPSTINNNDPHNFDQFFDLVYNVVVSPANSNIFAATYGAIFRSTDGGSSWTPVLGRQQSPYNFSTDIAVASNGDVYAVMGKHGAQITEYGAYRSTDNGANWTQINPPGLTADPQRMVVNTAPSDPNTVYVLVQVGNGSTAAEHQLFKYNAGSNSWTNLSSTLPNFADLGKFDSQGGYDLYVKVKPDNPNTFWLGATNLYRTTDGGQTYDWVGGYHQTDFLYQNHHPDNHSMSFYPNNANALISGHDGGLSKATNALESPQTWASLNNGYLTSQFYATSVDPNPGGVNMLGGLQDNGSWLLESNTPNADWVSVFSGDGAYNAISPGGFPFYVSSQSGNVFRVTISGNQAVYSMVTPANAQNFLFITPFVLDPNDYKVMYMAAGGQVWRNSNLDGIPSGNGNPTSVNWTALTGSAVADAQVTAIAIAKSPANRLYFGATNYQSTTVLKRVDNAASNPAGTIITPGVTQGSYPSCIAVNPNNGDEIIAVFSSYGVQGLWYSSNAGASWTNIDGNLSGQSSPAKRWASIVPTASGTVYFIATSTGIYSTTSVSGTVSWQQEGATLIGNVPTDMLVSRPADGLIVAATHGRGVYSATVGGGGSPAIANVNVSQVNIELQPNQTRSRSFQLSNVGGQPLSYSVSVSGLGNADKGGFRNMLSENSEIDEDSPQAFPPKKRPAQLQQISAAGKVGQQSAFTPQHPLIDVLYLDDGDATSDDFIGTNDFVDFYWATEYNLTSGFQLEQIDFYMRTEGLFSNLVYVGVYSDLNGNALDEGLLNFNTAPSGGWFTVTLTPGIQFNAGSTFYLVVGADGLISFPAGADVDATIPNKSYYFDNSSFTWKNLNTVGGFENGAFLVRALGTISGGGNTPPNAVASVPTTGNTNQAITFDGSGSNDTDGTISQYSWNFGDGTNGSQAVTSHTYSQPNTYTWTLTVTDDDGATDQATGQITISNTTTSRLTVTPGSGTVAAGGSQTIVANYDATNQPEGTYNGQISITTNGGNITLPVTVLVSNLVGIDDDAAQPEAFELEQNFPNPFNPATTIRYKLGAASPVSLKIYDMLGREIKTLVANAQPAGSYEIVWDGTNARNQPVPSGVYLYRLQTDNFSEQRKMILSK